MDEYLDRHEHYDLKRDGRFLIAELQTPHQVLSTSAHRGGLCTGIRYLVNHQSCEGTGHDARFALIRKLGQAGYHRHVCAERGLPPDGVAVMGTAANMNCAAHVVKTYAELRVCAVVTAGVEGNAGCAGDPATWHEEDEEWIRNASARGYDQHHGPHQLAAHAGRDGAGGSHDDRGQVGRAARPRRVEPVFSRPSQRAPAPTSIVLPRRWTKRESRRPTRAITRNWGS